MNKKRKSTKSNPPDLGDRFLVESYQTNERAQPPDNLPVYRLLTGKDDAEFCKKVSEALSLGYQLYGSPSIAFNGTDMIAAQAVTWPSDASYRFGLDDNIPF